jgi:hypothetical protein
MPSCPAIFQPRRTSLKPPGNEPLGDPDIRRALVAELLGSGSCSPETVIVEELVIRRGVARIDVAVLDGQLHGYEIKSERDSLDRLPRQVELFSAAFNTVTVVAHRRHLRALGSLVPPWWGIACAERVGADVALKTVRAACTNESVDVPTVARLLWRGELLDALSGFVSPATLRRQSRAALSDLFAATVAPHVVGQTVRTKIAARNGWRQSSVALQTLSGDDGEVMARADRNPAG